MSYALSLVGDAIADLRDLDLGLQEEVIDELDKLCADVSPLRRRTSGGRIIYDFVRDHGGVSHYVFLTLVRDDARRRLRVLGIAHLVRPASP